MTDAEYTFTDRCGDPLTVTWDGTYARITAPEDVTVIVRLNERRDVLEGLARGMGLNVIILDRLDWRGAEKTAYTWNGWPVTREGRRIQFAHNDIDASTARGLARVLAELAEAADDEPDPEQYAALHSAVVEALGEGGEAAPATADRIARHLLRNGWKDS